MKRGGAYAFFGLVPLVLIIIAISWQSCAGLYAKSGPVVPLSPENFYRLVIESDVVSVVSGLLLILHENMRALPLH